MKRLIFLVAFIPILLNAQQSGIVNNFDINNIVINSTSLNQIASKITFSFEQDGDKKTSNDGNYVTVTYKNNSLIRPLITYTRNGDVTQIVLLVPLSISTSIGKDLIRKFGTTYVNGEEVVRGNGLTYDIRHDNEVGVIVIYK
jgi:hypothetical protein